MKNDIVKNGIIGFIIGDAIEVPLEFSKRRNEYNKIVDNKGNIDYEDIMNNFIKWAEN